MAAPGSSINMDSASAQVKRLINTQLKNVCKGASLPVSGAKAALQSRIISQLQLYASSGDYDSFQRLKSLVFNPDMNVRPPSGTAGGLHHNHNPASYSHYQTSYPTPQPQHRPAAPHVPSTFNNRPQLNFKESPFSKIISPLTRVHKLDIRETTRDTLRDSIALTQEVVNNLSDGNNMKVMIYCAADLGVSPFSRLDVAFPQQVEIRINGDEVKANLRGLKNKPGTTRPADITNFLRKRSGYSNELQITYALTKSRFHLVVYLVKQTPVEDLVAELKKGRLISKERVLREMQSCAEDQDIVATSTNLSLKCPLSYLRIAVPCRSTVCKHNQCFDATSFLQLQEQAPTWSCPVCHETVSFGNLQVDQYVNEILKSTAKSVDQVTIDPTGQWTIQGHSKALPSPDGRTGSSDADEDLIEIHEPPNITSIKREANQESSLLRTPPTSSREPSTSAGNRVSSGSKRPASQVVDLTLSSDEDDEPVRTPKRRQTTAFTGGAASSIDSEQMPFRNGALSPMQTNLQNHASNTLHLSDQFPTTTYSTTLHHTSSY